MPDHWDRFWSGESDSGGCLPARRNPVEVVQREIWQQFAGRLPKGAKVIDLASGDGRVMAWLLERRPDLKPVGIDRAEHLPKAPSGARLRGGISIESMPFADASFDAATSQFGIEYGELQETCTEICRVLRPNGAFRLLVHHKSGPIVRHNLARAQGIKWASRDSGAVAKARNFVSARSIAVMPTPSLFRELVSEACTRFGANSGAEEFTLALFQTLEFSRNAPPHEALEAIAELKQSASDELARIEALTDAAADSAKANHIASLLRQGGALVQQVREVADRTGNPPFGWIIEGTTS